MLETRPNSCSARTKGQHVYSEHTMIRRKVIALMMGTAGLRGDYQGLVRAGVEQRCIENGIDLWVYAGRNDWRPWIPAQGRVYELVAPDRIDGIILAAGCIACFLDVNELLAMFHQRCPVPICSVGHRLEGIPSLTIDNRTGMAIVVDHMASFHGYRNFAFIAGPRGHEESEERLGAARDALARLGLELPEEAVAYGNFSLESGAVLMRELMDRLPALDAVVTANDDMAAGVLEALAGRGRRCPEDIAVAGFDDAPSARICTPSLTTSRQPVFQLGIQAADCIMATWRGETCPPLITLQTEAVLRESCGCDPFLGPQRVFSGSGESSEPIQQKGEIATLLSGLVGDKSKRIAWADHLWRAVDAETSGQSGSLQSVLQRLLDEASDPDAQLYDLQHVISYLRTTRADETTRRDLDEVFHSALIQIGHTMHRRETRRRLHHVFLMEELRLSWERLATSLSFDSLREALLRDLPRFSVRNAIISVFPPGGFETLMPLACMVDGEPVALEPQAFPAIRLKPDGVPVAAGRCSFAVMPLTFEWEPLGVAMIELPVHEDYMVLREQIGSAVKTVRLHETLMQQQERLKVQAQAENQATTERLRTMSLIAGGVAHDLNNALGPLLALPEAMRQDLIMNAGSLPENLLADLDTLQEAAQRAAHTIRDLLTLGRTIDVPKQTFELNRILNDGRRALSQLAERADGVRLRLLINEAPLLVYVSREHLVRAVSNLVANAADAMSTPGEVVVRVRERKVTQKLEGIEPVERGHYAVIEVEDSGCGIPKENLHRVLEPFFSSKSQTARGGTGLGLAIVHQVVSQCRGYVQVTSEVGVGTTFALYLPLVTQGEADESEPPAPALGGDERILVVDDERVQLRTAQRILGQLGYRVSTAESGAAAIALFEREFDLDPYQLVILDMLMPGSLNGLATLKQMRNRKPSQKALVATGYAPEQMNCKAADNGVCWLAKPYTAAGLARAVRTALETQVEPLRGSA